MKEFLEAVSGHPVAAALLGLFVIIVLACITDIAKALRR
jgi:hypothetical protein